MDSYENDKRISDNLSNHGWSTRWGSEKAGSQSLTTPDLLYTSAERWFKNNTDNVVSVSYYTGPIGSAIASGFMGCDDSGHVVAIVSLDELQRDNVATVASDDVRVGSQHNAPKPLLVLSYRHALTREQVDGMSAILSNGIRQAGWTWLVVDCMDEAKVQAFGIDAPTLDTLSTDDIIEALASLVRVREAAGEGDTRFNR